MLLFTILKVSLRSLWANKLRSFLAMLGIIIGVAAVISMLALGAGAKSQVISRISSMGANILTVRPGQSYRMGVRGAPVDSLTLEDAEAVMRQIRGINQIAPAVGRSAQVKYLNNNTFTSIVGTSMTYFPLRSFEIEKGRSFTEGEVERKARVTILGPTTVESLFKGEDPLNKQVKINGQNFLVIGVTKAKGDQGFYNPDDQVVIPYTVAMKQMMGTNYLRELYVQAKDGVDLVVMSEQITELLRRRHRIREGQEDDFHVRNQTELLEMFTEMTRTFTILLGGIASISLLVGGIGIMNIMLVTVTERTREIGIRKAIGARNRDILRQFLIESTLMSILGGSIGVGVGMGVARIFDIYSDYPSVVETPSVILALVFAIIVGIFFGWYPARRAALLDPVDALRYE